MISQYYHEKSLSMCFKVLLNIETPLEIVDYERKACFDPNNYINEWILPTFCHFEKHHPS